MAVIRGVVNGITAYLNFEFACDRGYAFSERGMASALAQLIHAAEKVDSIEFEAKHPVLVSNKRGRPRSCDIRWAKDGGNRWIEYKWFGYSSPTLHMILRDIYRMGVISRATGDPTFFLMCGMKRSVAGFLARSENQRVVRKKAYSLVRDSNSLFPVLRPEHLPKKILLKLESEFGVPLPFISMEGITSTVKDESNAVARCCALGFEVKGK
ncbi:hypothetical protein [Lysobacter sp. Root690]|uniref:hypothetical protein n=1 Tax=Lysobacter sp. Root690 TaxID=1736588 RepID=UPI000AC3188B|nr:hypothetical protein [Lysobacter sp. Root690]